MEEINLKLIPNIDNFIPDGLNDSERKLLARSPENADEPNRKKICFRN